MWTPIAPLGELIVSVREFIRSVSPTSDPRNKRCASVDLTGFLKIGHPNKPIIAEILIGTDIRVAGRGTRFGMSEARWSLYPMMGSAARLPQQIPHTKAVGTLGEESGLVDGPRQATAPLIFISTI
jgi:hypothetical protein